MSRRSSSAAVFGALGDGTRLDMVSRLAARGPLSIRELSEGLPLTRQGATKHLNVLSQAGLVRVTPHGRERVYQLDGNRLAQAREELDAIARQWETKLSRLKAFLESE